MQVSYFEPLRVSLKMHPCILYMHGNSSSRLEGLSLLEYIIPNDISLLIIDFCGCGMSEGEYISLGYYEKEDAGFIIDYFKKTKMISSIGLWGRSMGAATALMLGTMRDDIEFIVADSAYISINVLCLEIARK